MRRSTCCSLCYGRLSLSMSNASTKQFVFLNMHHMSGSNYVVISYYPLVYVVPVKPTTRCLPLTCRNHLFLYVCEIIVTSDHSQTFALKILVIFNSLHLLVIFLIPLDENVSFNYATRPKPSFIHWHGKVQALSGTNCSQLKEFPLLMSLPYLILQCLEA